MSIRRLAPAALAVLALAVPAFAAENYTIDDVHSQVVFKINHAGFSNNYGVFKTIAGSFTMDGANSKVEVTIKADSVDTFNGKRNSHINGPDFFNTKEFPTITFKSKSVKSTGEKTMDVMGDLTFLGVTKPVTIKVTQIGSGKGMQGEWRSGFEGMFTIKRTDFGNKTYVEGGGLGDEVHLMVNIEGVRN